MTYTQKTIPEFRSTFDDDQLFRFSLLYDGEPLTVTLKPMNELPLGIVEDAYDQARDGDEQGATWATLRWGAATPEDRELMRRLPGRAMELIMEAWQKHSEIELGESSRLPTSSDDGATAKPSSTISSELV